MDISLQKRISSRQRAVLAGLCMLGCCLFANVLLTGVSSAEVPTKGINCIASDGKISGRGSTYQNVLQKNLIEAYSSDFCGQAGTQYSGDPAGENMIAYNTSVGASSAQSTSETGSGAGLRAASCRTDAFAGTDNPYTEKQLEELNAAPGIEGGSKCKTKYDPPYTPQATKNAEGLYEFPNSTDATAPLMSFPVGGSAVALVVNFGSACTVKDPTSLLLTAKEVSRLFGGDVATWADSELDATNSALSSDGCTGAVTRIVRQDSSGTTNIFKQYLIRAENTRTGQKCGVISGAIQNWEQYFSTNTEWPGLTTKYKASEEGTCSAIKHPTESGNTEELELVKNTAGSIGYADLPNAKEFPTLVEASVENSTGASKVQPSASGGANCTYTGILSLPGSGDKDAVGLAPEETAENPETKKTENVTLNWANNAPGVPENVTDRGTKYPICGLTFDIVYTGLHAESGVSNAITPLTNDQRRTLYSYFTFVLSSAAQNELSTIYYAPLPSSILQELREGFQENF